MLPFAKKTKKQARVIVATGKFDDGRPFYRPEDIKSSSAYKLKLLPVGDVPLVVDATNERNDSFGTYDGPSVPWIVKESSGGRTYRCRRVVKEDDDGHPLVYCTKECQESFTMNFTSLLAHCRTHHWNQKSTNAP